MANHALKSITEINEMTQALRVFKESLENEDLSQYDDLAEEEVAAFPNWMVLNGKKIPISYNKADKVFSLRDV